MRAPPPILTDFRRAQPRYRIPQQQALTWLSEAHARAERTQNRNDDHPGLVGRFARVIERVGCGTDRIGSRASELADFTHTRWSEMEIYTLDRVAQGQGAGARSRVYADKVQSYFEHAYADEAEAPADLIHVTCTGYVSPSAAQVTMQRRGWGARTRVTHAYHMGCYAAFPALRMGRAWSTDAPNSRIDIVHTELCTLHLDPSQHSPEQLVVQSLFADGYIRYSLRAESAENGLAILALDEAIMPESSASMSWICSDWGMQMTLARDVPDRIARGLVAFLQRLFGAGGHNFGDARRDAIFAVHPGGPKIIDCVRDVLSLDERQLVHSRRVLFERGNMSSATLPHVWLDLVDDATIPKGTLIASLAFGPGLTVCGGLMVKT